MSISEQTMDMIAKAFIVATAMGVGMFALLWLALFGMGAELLKRLLPFLLRLWVVVAESLGYKPSAGDFKSSLTILQACNTSVTIGEPNGDVVPLQLEYNGGSGALGQDNSVYKVLLLAPDES